MLKLNQKKHAAFASGGGNASKVDESALKRYDYVEDLIKQNRVSSCTVAQLRDILNEHFGVKMPKTATKPILLERIFTEFHK